MTHDHGHVLEDEAVFDPPQAGDFVADLTGPSHVVVPDCPQVFRALHGITGESAAVCTGRPSLEAARVTATASSRYSSSVPAYVTSPPIASTCAAIDRSKPASDPLTSIAV